VTAGGQKTFNYHVFDGDGHRGPLVAMEVRDEIPENWPEACLVPYGSALNDPATWARVNVEKYQARAIALHLASIDPMGSNRSAAEAVKTVEAVLKTVEVPLLIFGCDHLQKDAEVLKLVAEVAAGRNVAIGPVQEKNYKAIGAAAIAYRQVVIASSPIDVNLAKQLNILLLELGVPENKFIIDPTTGG
ncbi:MAG TPA: hypothetical protein PKW42_03825, partial [bacterium]|nr:hypothetical protein [bacterium]